MPPHRPVASQMAADLLTRLQLAANSLFINKCSTGCVNECLIESSKCLKLTAFAGAGAVAGSGKHTTH